MTATVPTLVAAFQKKELSIEEHTKNVLVEAHELDARYNYFTVLCEKQALERARALDILVTQGRAADLKLLGVPISVKDAICVKGVETTASSRILKGYVPPFNATVVQRCLDQGGIVIGKTVQDEFGFGGFSVNVGLGYKIPKNPFDPERSTGGSSGGCAGFTQLTSFPHVSLGESTGGSIVEPASFCGVIGLCPTYGRVSRYGLLDYANTLDKIGPLTKKVAEAALSFDVMAGSDPKDSTTLTRAVDTSSFVDKGVRDLKIGVIKEAFGDGTDTIVAERVWRSIKNLEADGASYAEVSLELPIKYGIPTYYTLSTSEVSTNLAKLCGIRYGVQEKLEGTFNEYFTKVRSKHFGEEAKRRIMLGTFARMVGFRDAFYIKALKIRQRMIQEYLKAFKDYDMLITPAAPILPPTFAEIEKLTPLQQYMIDILTVGPNLAGLPHMNVPIGLSKGLPVGVMLIASHCNEATLIQTAASIQKRTKVGEDE